MDLTKCIDLTKLDKILFGRINKIIGSAKIINYNNPTVDSVSNEYSLDAISSVEICDADKKETSVIKGFVYLLLDMSGNCLYVGSSRDIKSRLDSHLIRNNKFKKDGTPKKSLTGSEIDNVYDHVKDTKSIKYCYTRVEPWYLYTTVENKLINYFREKNKNNGINDIWNAGHKDDDVSNESPPK